MSKRQQQHKAAQLCHRGRRWMNKYTVNYYLNKKGGEIDAQLPSWAKSITPLCSFFWSRRWLLMVLRTISHRVTNWRWCNIRTGLIVPLRHWWWRRIHLLLWWVIWTRWWWIWRRGWRIYSWKVINLATLQLINFLNHIRKKEENFTSRTWIQLPAEAWYWLLW